MTARAIPTDTLPAATLGEALSFIAKNLRPADLREVQATVPGDVSSLVILSVLMSEKAWLVIDDVGTPLAVFGVAGSAASGVGVPWLLTAAGLEQEAKSFARQTRTYIREMHALFPTLTNHVDLRNEEAIRWLRWAGFDFVDVDLNYGVSGEPFLQFTRTA